MHVRLYIFERLLTNMQEEHKLLHLLPNKVIKIRACTKVPINDSIVDQSYALEVRDKMPKSLKLHNKINILLFDSAWIIGMDYNETNNNNIETDYEHNNNKREYEVNNNNEDEINNNGYDDQQDNMDKNKLADILNQSD